MALARRLATRRLQAKRRGRLGVPAVNENPQPPNAAQASGGNVTGTLGDGPVIGGATSATGTLGNNGVRGPGGRGRGRRGNGPGRPRHGHRRNRNRRSPPPDTFTNWEDRQQELPVGPSVSPTKPLNAQTVEEQIQSFNGNPASALAFSSFEPGEGQVDPRDDKYWANVSNLLFNTQGKYNEAILQGQRNALDYETGLSDMSTNRARQQRALAEAAMRQGLANSGWRDRTDAEDTSDFLREFEDYQTDYTRGEQDRRSAMSSVIQDFISGERDLAADAVRAYGEAQADRAGSGPLDYTLEDIQGLENIFAQKPQRRRRRGRGRNR